MESAYMSEFIYSHSEELWAPRRGCIGACHQSVRFEGGAEEWKCVAWLRAPLDAAVEDWNKLVDLTIRTGAPGTLQGVLPSSLRVLRLELPPSASWTCKFELPEGLEELRVSHGGLAELPQLPTSLQVLEIPGYAGSLPPLPQLLELNISHSGLEQLPALPDSLQVLYASQNLLRRLPALPAGLLHAELYNNLLEELPPLPPTLLQLNVLNNKLRALPNNLPPTLQLHADKI